jgi:hypothetical protein
MNERSWGMRFNQYQDFSKTGKTTDCPDWLEQSQLKIWHEQGLIVWNDIDKKIEALNGSYILRLLDELESQDTWKSDGIAVTKLVSEFSIELPKRGRNKKNSATIRGGIK